MAGIRPIPIYIPPGAAEDFPPVMNFRQEDGEDFDKALTRNGFPGSPSLRIGEEPGTSYLTIELYEREASPQCLIDIGDANGFILIAAMTLQTGLDLCARWASMVTASSLAHWPELARDFMLHTMPDSAEIDAQRAADRRARQELAAKRRARQ